MKKQAEELHVEHLFGRIQEAENTLRYALRLSKAFEVRNRGTLIKENMMPQYFDKVSETIWNDCVTFTAGGDFNFFGYKGDYENPHGKPDRFHDLSILNYRPEFWSHIFKQDAILFAFCTLRKLIGESCPITTYMRAQLSNFTTISGDSSTFDTQNHGFDFLLQEDNSHEAYCSLKATDNKVRFLPSPSFSMEGDTALMVSKYSSNFKRRITTLNKQLDHAGISLSALYLSPLDIKNESTSNSEDKNNNSSNKPWALLSMLEFYDFLVRKDQYTPSGSVGILPIINAFDTKKKFSYSQYENYISCVNRLLQSIWPGSFGDSYVNQPSHKMLMSDRIYLLCQIERVFGLSIIDCLYQNIVPTKGKSYNLCDQDDINLLSSCMLLPNLFTRNYILQMAVDTIVKHFDYKFGDSNFFSKKDTAFNAVVTYSHANNSYLHDFTKLSIWKRQYQHMVNYFSQILFPIYENYFFCVVWNDIRNLNPGTKDIDIAIAMYKKLCQYLNTPDYIKALFNTENTMIHSLPEWKGFKEENIIHPQFSNPKEDIDLVLYKKCLVAHSLTFEKEIIPDFISPNYFDHLSTASKEKIQTIYILDSINFKQ